MPTPGAALYSGGELTDGLEGGMLEGREEGMEDHRDRNAARDSREFPE